MVISSRLLKAYLLYGNSALFPQLVEAACWKLGTPYDIQLLRAIASREEILGALDISDEGDTDSHLRKLLHEQPQDVDAVILAAVREYTEKKPEEEP